MFEHFTFGAQPHSNHHYYHDDEDISASPTDTSFPSPIDPPPNSIWPSDNEESGPLQEGINDIVNQLNNQSLSHDSEQPQRSIWPDARLPSPDYESFSEEDMTYVSTTRGMAKVHHSTRSLPNTPTIAPSRNGLVSSRRLQRQLNVQLQTCPNHTRDINALVESMVETNSQCKLHKTTSRPYLLSPPPSRHGSDGLVVASTEFEVSQPILHEDEGFGDVEDPSILMKEEVSLRRASTPSGIRKHGVLRCRSSAECVGGNGVTGPSGRAKVRSLPRMRKRKIVRVPE